MVRQGGLYFALASVDMDRPVVKWSVLAGQAVLRPWACGHGSACGEVGWFGEADCISPLGLWTRLGFPLWVGTA